MTSNSENSQLSSNLSRQQAEVVILRSIYGGEGEFELSPDENAILEILSNLDSEGDIMELGSVSFTINLLDIELGGRHVSIGISMPHGYPETEPLNVIVRCGGGISRAEHDAINRQAREVACNLIGQESVLEVVNKVQEVAFNASNRKRDSSKNSIEATSSTCQSFCIKHVLIWFHHIKSLEKRKSILGWAKALNLGGYCKPGFPGIIVVEGEKRDVDVYVKQLQSLRWQAMSVREEQEEEVLIESEVNNKRCFLNGMKELDENGMSDLGRLCREANLENLFLSALKINR
eukprot:TRINITY_DN3069_c0_g1_i1.p1 TRINITY_DN3069_c0_g1~~TRINITY_DN3069_c0_g1_i1.p1  ORF type:complete len:290 (+),score=56.71 TRINITY_DN3069_c0_g1_i1:131-1000(+)